MLHGTTYGVIGPSATAPKIVRAIKGRHGRRSRAIELFCDGGSHHEALKPIRELWHPYGAELWREKQLVTRYGRRR